MLADQQRRNELLFMRLIVMFVCSLFVLSVPYISILFLLAGAVLFAAQFCKTLRIDRHVAAFVLLLLYVFSWGLVTGGFSFSSLTQPSFYGGEGRIIIASLPLFLIFAAPQSLFTEKNVNYILRILFYLCVVSAFLAAAGLSHTMFGSHHAAGYAAGALFVVFTSLYAEERKRWYLIGIFAAVAMLMFANSRTTLVGLAMSFAIYYRSSVFKPKIVIGALISMFSLIYIWSFVSPESFERFSGIFDSALWSDIREQAIVASFVEDPGTGNVERVGSNWNVLTRVILWVRAFWFFEQSPILGIGSFRFNDSGLYLNTVMSGLAIGQSEMLPTLSVATAHNSYFHVLAEGGILGLAIYLTPWLMILQTLKNRRKTSPTQKAMAKAGSIMVLFMMFGALTGHLLASPSMTLWVLLTCGIALRLGKSKAPVQNEHFHTPLGVTHAGAAQQVRLERRQ